MKCLITLLVVAAMVTTASAGTYDQLNIQDTGIRVGNTGNYDGIWSQITDVSTGTYYALSQFSLTGIESSVTSASLDIILRDWSEISSHSIEVYLLNSADEDWDETTANGPTKDGTTAWVGGSRPYDATGASASVTWTPTAGSRGPVIIDVTSLVQQMITEGRTDGTFVIASSSAPDWDNHASMGQKELKWDRPSGAPYNDYDFQRLTVVSTIPEPATMGLLLVGGLGVLARRRRR